MLMIFQLIFVYIWSAVERDEFKMKSTCLNTVSMRNLFQNSEHKNYKEAILILPVPSFGTFYIVKWSI